MLPLLLVAVLSQPVDVEVDRLKPRVRAGVSVSALSGFSFAARTFALGPGGDLEIGVTIKDVFGLVLRMGLAVPLFNFPVWAALCAELRLDDWFYLSAGLGGYYLGATVTDLGGSSLGLYAPVRAIFFWPWPETPHATRGGWSFYIEAAPGLSLLGGMGLAVIGSAGFGYSWK